MSADEFSEIAHSGGTITFSFRAGPDGNRGYQVRIQADRPVPMVWTGLYALFNGIPVASLSMGGIGSTSEPPPFSGCYPVYIQSDSEGKFGHNCPRCEKYWRSGPWPAVCPYCALHADGFQFLSMAQRKFVSLYCDLLMQAEERPDITDVKIDMNAVADAVGSDQEKPAFYISEERQQSQFNCGACGEFNDVLGKFVFCSLCGTRNDLAVFEQFTLPALRTSLNSGTQPHDCVRNAVAAFDSFVAQYAKQLAALIPMLPERRERLRLHAFHDLEEVQKIFSNWFGIDICKGLRDAERQATSRMFLRRHLYEHNGGQVDEKYIQKSGDTGVKIGQAIRETQEAAHDLLGTLLKMAQNLHRGFNSLFPPNQKPIENFNAKTKRIKEGAH